MKRVQKLLYKGKQILIVDYSDCSKERLFHVFEEARDLVLREKGRYLVLNVFNKGTYLSGSFMTFVQEELPKVDEYIEKHAITGLSDVQVWIVKALNLWYKRQIVSFPSMDKALEFLVIEG